MNDKLVFGPVPSRRLGQSLGINNIPYKHCSYSCIYCQIGKTPSYQIERTEFHDPSKIIKAAIQSVKKAGKDNVDYITFVPDGEPTLDINLGKEIKSIKDATGVKIAVITNSSLLYRDDVRLDLLEADLVSVKIDAVTDALFKKIDRPHGKLDLKNILNGIKTFSRIFKGKIITETMLLKGLNDNDEELEKIAKYMSDLNADRYFISIPTRPPAEKWAIPAGEQATLMAHEIFSKFLNRDKVELLLGIEGFEFHSSSSDPVQGFLAITSVHPMRFSQAREYFNENGLEFDEVKTQLLKEGKILVLDYMNEKFILRKIEPRKPR
ncbi:MAG: radical SAM protein [Promethearchaeota archaeon]